jgi:hypothetical protein
MYLDEILAQLSTLSPLNYYYPRLPWEDLLNVKKREELTERFQKNSDHLSSSEKESLKPIQDFFENLSEAITNT